MGMMDRMRGAIARTLRFREAEGEPPVSPPVADDPVPAGRTRDNDDGWTRISGRIGERDLMPMDQTRMQEVAVYLWENNPLAKPLIELPTAFLLGEGVRLECGDPEMQDWLNDFWNDPLNALDLKLCEHVRELAIFGELLLPVRPNEITGRIRLTKVDPSRITAVITDPDDDGVVIGVQARDSIGTGELRTWRVIYSRPDVELFSPETEAMRAGFAAGDCFFLRVNSLSSGRRGRSDLLPVADTVDAHEQLMFGEVERSVALRSISWDVTLKGATPEQVEERARDITPPEPLSVRVHNDAEEWDLITPQLNSADADTAATMVRNHVLGCQTIPQHWLADGGDVNLATASAMGEPTYKVMTQRQKLWRAMLEDIGTYVARRRLEALGLGLASKADAYKVRAIFPPLTAKDVTKFATVLAQVVVAVAQAVSSGLMSRESAVRLIAMQAELLGLEVDPLEELRIANEELAKKREEDAFTDPLGPPLTMPAAPTPDPTAPREPA